MTDKLEALKAAALAATSQDIDTAQTVDSDGHMECPHCSGEGRVDVGGDYCNYDSVALGVLFYGIGDAHVKAEAYFRAAKPAVVLELLAALEEKDQRIAELQQRLQPLNFQTSAEEFLAHCLKAEEISGDKQQTRIKELIGWFSRYYRKAANPKWLSGHVAELCYFIIKNAQAEQRLQQPIKLRARVFEMMNVGGGHSIQVVSVKTVKEIIRAAGFKVEVEGE